MNRVTLIGRLTKDPDCRQAGETSLARYTIAADRRGKDKGADFISCVAFGKNADFAAKYLHKGTKIAIEGRIQTGSYKKNDQTIYTTDVIVESHEFVEPRTVSAASDAPITVTTDAPTSGLEGFVNVPDGIDDVLPFV